MRIGKEKFLTRACADGYSGQLALAHHALMLLTGASRCIHPWWSRAAAKQEAERAKMARLRELRFAAEAKAAGEMEAKQ